MLRENHARVALLVVAVVSANLVSGANTLIAESYDKPIRKAVVNLGRSPELMPNNPARIQLSCFYYANFTVKELDDPGLKGTRWVTITPAINKDLPACRLAHTPTERFLAKEWWSFEGVKGSLLFLRAADGQNGGMPFRIMDWKTGKKIFEDSSWSSGNLDFVPTSEGTVTLRYLRVVSGDCSIPKDGISCWSEFRSRYGLVLATIPKCTNSVVDDKGVAPELNTPSAIAYPVEVELFPRPSLRAVPGPVLCRQVD